MVLSAGKIGFQKLPHANYGHEHDSIVSSLCFHPRENLLLTTGLDRQAKLMQVSHNSIMDGSEKPNYNNVKVTQKSKKIAGIFLPDMPIYQGKFISGGDQLILTGNRKHFYTYDVAEEKLQRLTVGTLDQKNLTNLVTGRAADSSYFTFTSKDTGEAHMFSQKTKKLLYSLQMNGSCEAACFSPDDRYLFTAGDQAEVYQWDLRMRRCLNKLADEGSFSTTCIDVSPNGRFLATGSKMGSVNMYALNESYEEAFGVQAADSSKLKSSLFSKG